MMIRRNIFAASAMLLLSSQIASSQTNENSHKYLYIAQINAEGIKDLQKVTATVRRDQIAKFGAAIGCKLDFYLYDASENTVYGLADCPDDIAAAAGMVTNNAAGLSRVTVKRLLSAEDMDKVLLKSSSVSPPSQR
jgi:hypothetical protein